jgi:hypothetical protein
LRLTNDSIIVRDAEPTTAAFDQGVMVLSVRAGSYFSFNAVASDIWTMLAEPRSVGQIFDALTLSHDVDAATLARDVTPFLETLVSRRLARVVRPSAVR